MKTDNDIEILLRSGRNTELSPREKAAVKSELLDHARDTLKYARQQSSISWWSLWSPRFATVFAVFVVASVGTAYASVGSLPGDPLYAMKVHVVEEVILLTKTDPVERAYYDIELMETRLDELKAVTEDGEALLDLDTVSTISDQIAEHVADVTETLESADIRTVNHKKKIAIFAKVATITQAQVEVVEDDQTLQIIEDTAQDATENMSDLTEDTVNEFADTQSVEDVNEYLSRQLNDIGVTVQATSIDQSTREQIEQHLQDVNESLIDGDVAEAIISTTEAQQEIDVTEYVSDEVGTTSESFNTPETSTE